MRVAAYGEVDELNAVLGLARAHSADAAVRTLLHDIQKDLFALGAQLTDPEARIGSRKQKAAVTTAQVEVLERAIGRAAGRDAGAAGLPPPGRRPRGRLPPSRPNGVPRRAERATVSLARREKVDPLVVAYMNRLSDLLFVLAREANLRAGEAEEKW